MGRCWLFLGLISGLIKAQEPAAPLVRAGTHVVLLDVVASDAKGKPIDTLTSDDFTIFENGVEQKIASFEGPATHGSGAMALPNSPRTIILVDELNIQFSDLSYARDRTILFLSEHGWEHNLTAILTIGRTGLHRIQDYTQDIGLLKEKMMSFKPGLNNPLDGYMDSGKVSEHALQSIDGLLAIARASVGAPYNLNVIWITSGFPGTLQETKTVDGHQNGIRRLANLLMAARMRLYTIDPGGVQPLQPTIVATPINTKPLGGTVYQGQSSSDEAAEYAMAQGPAFEANQLLTVLTGMTGGRAYFGRNDVEVALREAEIEGTSDYAISYAPLNGDFHGEYRRIQIRTKVDGVVARTRLGYYASPDDTAESSEAREEKRKAALASPLTYGAFQMACPMNYDVASGHVTGVLTVKPTPIIMQSQPESVAIVRAAGLSKSGEVVGGWSWEINNKQTWTNRVTKLSFDKPLPKKAHAVRFLISDVEADHLGTCDFQVPEK